MSALRRPLVIAAPGDTFQRFLDAAVSALLAVLLAWRLLLFEDNRQEKISESSTVDDVKTQPSSSLASVRALLATDALPSEAVTVTNHHDEGLSSIAEEEDGDLHSVSTANSHPVSPVWSYAVIPGDDDSLLSMTSSLCVQQTVSCEQSAMMATEDSDRDRDQAELFLDCHGNEQLELRRVCELDEDGGNSLQSTTLSVCESPLEQSFNSNPLIDESPELPPPPPPDEYAPPMSDNSSSKWNRAKAIPMATEAETPVEAIDVDLARAMRRVARFGQVYADAAATTALSPDYMSSSSPPNEPPPPPPPLEKSIPIRPADPYKNGFQGYRPREIPVHRATSAATSILDYRDRPPVQPSNDGEEYYRREVLTRTVVTRSSQETLSNPLSRMSPVIMEHYRETPHIEETTYKYTRNLEEEERLIREAQKRRRDEEETRRRAAEADCREWELRVEKERVERELREKEVEFQRQQREKRDRDRIERDRLQREEYELQRRKEWEQRERERRELEDAELAKIKEKERLEAERRRIEIIERERIERERIERERIEIERIERIKREKEERELREEQERIERERLEIERLERLQREREEREQRERIEAEKRREADRLAAELIAQQKREAEERERQRIEDERQERLRREQEIREQERLRAEQRAAAEREAARQEAERRQREQLEYLQREAARIELECAENAKRERELAAEEERRAAELRDAQRRAAQRETERREDERKEQERRLAEEREAARRELERQEALRRERLRQEEERAEAIRIMELNRAAAFREPDRIRQQQLEQERHEVERREAMLRDQENREREKRERERMEEHRRLDELREVEKRNAALREAERQEMIRRAAEREREDRKSRDRLDQLQKERERLERENWDAERRRVLAERELAAAAERKRDLLTSRETLEQLTRQPYYSRENLNEVTKVERQVIERYDRVWTSDEVQRTQPVSYSRGPLSLTGMPAEISPSSPKDRIYQQRRLNDDEDLQRGSARRTSRYRAKIEKARKDFLAGDDTAYDPLGDRFRKSTDDLQRPRPEYRGPLLQKFHSGEFHSAKPDLGYMQPYPRVGPSPYDQEFTRLVAKAERDWSAYKHRLSSQANLYSRPRAWSASYLETDVDTGLEGLRAVPRQVEETNLDDVHRPGSVIDYRLSRKEQQDNVDESHTRSRSADFLMDRRMREESAPPENQLQKVLGDSSRQISEHEMRFRRSVEKIQVPDWYTENRTAKPTDLDHSFGSPASDRHQAVYNYGHSPSTVYDRRLPVGIFDKYKDEIEALRRSRDSLHQLGEHRQEDDGVRYLSADDLRGSRPLRLLPGYTVSSIPTEWNWPRDRSSRVVEVADTFVGPRNSANGSIGQRYGGRVTIEEVLDSIFLQTEPVVSVDSGLDASGVVTPVGYDGPSIYTKNYMLMDHVLRQPDEAEHLLKTQPLAEARLVFVSCKHCYTYYCSRQCRKWDWEGHKERCSFGRINTLCKDVIMKVREDSEAQLSMSRVARDGFAQGGRGSVNLRLPSAHLAQAYVSLASGGWSHLSSLPHPLIFYYTIPALIDERKDPSLIALCRKYEPHDKFILSVSIIADIERCPETPPPERKAATEGNAWPRTESNPWPRGAVLRSLENMALPSKV